MRRIALGSSTDPKMKRGRKPIPHQSIAGVEHKYCSRCKEWKPLADFGDAPKCRATWDGKKHRCAKCAYEYSRDYRLKLEAALKANPPPLRTTPKRCSRCREIKPADDFYPCVTKQDGRASYCAPCSRAYLQERAKLARVKAARRVWAATKGRRAVAVYNERWPAKKRARLAVQGEIQAGRMANPRVCSACSSTERVEAHHDDYALPLEVRWLCRWCHRAWHREHGHGRNADLVARGE